MHGCSSVSHRGPFESITQLTTSSKTMKLGAGCKWRTPLPRLKLQISFQLLTFLQKLRRQPAPVGGVQHILSINSKSRLFSFFLALIKGRTQRRALIQAAARGAKCAEVTPHKFKVSLQIFIYVCFSRRDLLKLIRT